VEARQTFVGKEKQLYYLQNKDKYKEFHDKIIHIVVDLPHKYPLDISKGEQWVNEKFQRDCIKNGLEQLNLSDEDIIIISDLDEIVDPVTLGKIKDGEIQVSLNSLEMQFYYYNLNTLSNSLWSYAKALTFKNYNESNMVCSKIRLLDNCPKIEKGGWHLSYFGDSKFIKNKIEHFSHQEFNNESYTNLDTIESRMSSGQDIYGRWYCGFKRIPISENLYLPPEYKKYLTKFILIE
jgi:beta-1,4-mannosyl-glycoprotein beta-1,4-N-acetylglucosaminyltransferase